MKQPPIILHQRYYNFAASRKETLVDVSGDTLITSHQKIHIDYFREYYTLRRKSCQTNAG